MKDQVELYAVDEQGKRLLGSLLEPFWQTISSAFLNKANEVMVRANQSDPRDVNIVYQKKGEIVPLKPMEGFHPFISSSRIRIISGMSIIPNISQTGKMRVRFNEDFLTIDVKIDVKDSFEIVSLRPQWIELKCSD